MDSPILIGLNINKISFGALRMVQKVIRRYLSPMNGGALSTTLMSWNKSLKPTSVAAIGIILVAKVTAQTALFTEYLDKHDGKEK